jgi:hypothetical protein
MTGPSARPQLALVVGAGRSGTSLVAGMLGQLGFHIPQPEVVANRTNPRGFGEPRWVVDFHASLMKRAAVGLFDARPAAWEAAREAAARPARRTALRDWLAGELSGHDRIIVKDPRTSWFLPLWVDVAGELGADVRVVGPLRHPTEVLTSVRTTARDRQTEATRAAWWVNMSLGTERVTRDLPRGYLRYDELLTDWRAELDRVERRCGLPLLSDATDEQVASIDAFVDPSLRRAAAGWDAVDVPPAVAGLADEVWSRLGALTSGTDEPAARAGLDDLSVRYAALYGDAEAIADSSIQAAVARAVRRAQRRRATTRAEPARRGRRWLPKVGR